VRSPGREAGLGEKIGAILASAERGFIGFSTIPEGFQHLHYEPAADRIQSVAATAGISWAANERVVSASCKSDAGVLQLKD
jgi:hypothetical protein